jgi:hypothetical protein
VSSKPPELIEGKEASENFRDAMKKILSVSHATIQRRIKEHRKKAARNPHRRGPKAKTK